MTTGLEDDTTGHLSIVDTEEKQLQAIADLYAIAAAQPKYAEAVKNKDWAPDTEPLIILTWLLKKVGALADGAHWLIDTYQEKRKTRFRMVTFRDYTNYWLVGGRQHVALDFLPYLLKKDEALHNLIIDIVALVSRENGVPLWNEDGDYSEVLKSLKGEAFLCNEMYKGRYETYVDGMAAGYLQRISSRRDTVTEAQITHNLGRYNENSGRKTQVMWWIKNGLRLARYKRNILSSTFIPAYEDRSKVFTPYHSYKFVWSRHDRDPLYLGATRKMDALTCSYRPLEIGVTNPGQAYQNIQRDEFPEQLDYFMHQGFQHFQSKFRDYYCKLLLKDLEAGRSGTLLEILTDVEIQTPVRITV